MDSGWTNMNIGRLWMDCMYLDIFKIYHLYNWVYINQYPYTFWEMFLSWWFETKLNHHLVFWNSQQLPACFRGLFSPMPPLVTKHHPWWRRSAVWERWHCVGKCWVLLGMMAEYTSWGWMFGWYILGVQSYRTSAGGPGCLYLRL